MNTVVSKCLECNRGTMKALDFLGTCELCLDPPPGEICYAPGCSKVRAMMEDHGFSCFCADHSVQPVSKIFSLDKS